MPRIYRTLAVAHVVLILLIAGPPLANAKDAAPATPAEAAKQVIDAHRKKNGDALKAAAKSSRPSPWQVVDALVRQGAVDAAIALANACQGSAYAKLKDYIERATKAGSLDKVRRLLSEARTSAENKAWKAIIAQPEEDGDPSVPSIERLRLLAKAHAALGNQDTAKATRERVVRDALTLGWIRAATNVYAEDAMRHRAKGKVPDAIASMLKALRVAEDTDDKKNAGRILGNLALLHESIRAPKKVIEYHRRSLAMFRAINDRENETIALLNMTRAYESQGHVKHALTHAKLGLEIARELQGSELLLDAVHVAAKAEDDAGNTERALKLLDELHAVAAKHGSLSYLSLAAGRRGSIAQAQGKFDKAEAFYASARDLAMKVGDTHRAAKIGYNLATLKKNRGDYDGAIAGFEACKVAFRRAGDRYGIATVEYGMGTIYSVTGRYALSIPRFKRALAGFRDTGNRGAELQGLIALGTALSQIGEASTSRSLVQEALELAKKLGSPGHVAHAQSMMASIDQAEGRFDQARDRLAKAKAVYERMRQRPRVAMTVNQMASVALRKADFATALAEFSQAEATFRELGMRTRVLSLLLDRGFLLMRIGRADEGLRCVDEALGISASLDGKPHEGHIHGVRSVLLRQLGRLKEAEEAGVRSVSLLEAAKDHLRHARALQNLGLVYQAQQLPRKALDVFQRAVALKEARGNWAGAAHTLFNVGNVSEELGTWDETRAAYEKGMRYLERSPSPQTRTRLQFGLAKAAYSAGQMAKAIAYAKESISGSTAYASGLVGRDFAEVKESHFPAYNVGYAASAALNSSADMLWFLERGRANVFRADRDVESSIENKFLKQATRTALARAQAEERRRLSALKSPGPKRPTRAARAQLLGEWEKAREAHANLRLKVQRELSALHPLSNARVTTTKDLQSILGKNEAIVFYAVTPERAFAFVVTKESTRIVTLGETSKVLTPLVEILTKRQGWLTAADIGQMRAVLVEPLALPKSTKRVIISPMAEIGYMPLGATFTGLDVVSVPSGTVYQALLAKKDHGPTAPVLGIGDPNYRAESRPQSVTRAARAWKLTSLPNTRREIEKIADTKLLGNDASESSFLSALAKEKVWRSVHFACHGLVDSERPLHSALALSVDDKHDGLLSAFEVLGLRMSTDLCVLSACESGLGRVYRTEGILGLTRAFFSAGASRVLCSLWKVDDAATAALMAEFYTRWNPKDGSRGVDAAVALRQAQSVIRSKKKWSEPHFWAAWVLWGKP